jgi:hypothetical protein
MTGPTSRASLLGVLAAAFLLPSCAETPIPPPRDCRRAVYAPTGETIPLTVEFDDWMSSNFELVGYCLILDGASLTMQDWPGLDAAQRVSPPLRWEGAVSREGMHQVAFVAWAQGTGGLANYRFEIKSDHYFMVKGDPAPAIRAVLYERPDVHQVERRPMVEWEPNAGMVLPPGWKRPRTVALPEPRE